MTLLYHVLIVESGLLYIYERLLYTLVCDSSLEVTQCVIVA